jgi:hypothetical protein
VFTLVAIILAAIATDPATFAAGRCRARLDGARGISFS